MCMLMFIPTYGILFMIRFVVMITKYTVLDERRQAKEGKSQRQYPRSITRYDLRCYSGFKCTLTQKMM